MCLYLHLTYSSSSCCHTEFGPCLSSSSSIAFILGRTLPLRSYKAHSWCRSQRSDCGIWVSWGCLVLSSLPLAIIMMCCCWSWCPPPARIICVSTFLCDDGHVEPSKNLNTVTASKRIDLYEAVICTNTLKANPALLFLVTPSLLNSACQRQTGSAFSLVLVAPRDKVKITGDVKVRITGIIWKTYYLGEGQES